MMRRYLFAATPAAFAALAALVALVACSSSSSDPTAATTAPCTVRTTPSGVSVCEETTCPTGQASCGGACIDTRTNAANCGACGAACGSGATCVAGVCTVACAAPATACGALCLDLQHDNNHCGACGHGCASGTACAGGTCVAAAIPFDADAREIGFSAPRDRLFYILSVAGPPTLYTRLADGSDASPIVLGPERGADGSGPSQTMALAVDTSGAHAAVGLNDGLVVVDLASSHTTKVAGVGTTRKLLVGTQSVYFFQDTNGRETLRSYDLTTGDSASPGVDATAIYGVTLHPSEHAIYASWIAGGVRRYMVDAGRVTSVSAPVVVQDGCNPTAIWGDATGGRLFANCGSVYRAAPDEAKDGERIGTMGDYTFISDLVHDAAGHRIVVIAQTAQERAAGLYVSRLIELDDVSYAFKRELATPPVVSEGATYATRPRRVFLREGGRLLVVVDGVSEGGGSTRASGITTL